MSELREEQRTFLRDLFGTRVNFDRRERKLYGHDIAEMPGMLKPLVGETVPEAVVQPASEEEVVRLVNWAKENGVPLTPRGKASSGYGGVLPMRGGVVVDTWHLKGLVSVDRGAGTVTVEPGMVWDKLDRLIEKHGLSLRLYPSSYPSSTVGGWLAQGGAGFGSYEAGWFRDNVVSARAVLADGTVRDFSGADLDLVSDACGVTGIITRVTLKVMLREELTVKAVSLPDAKSLQAFAESVVREKLPFWSVVFINPKMVQLKNETPVRPHGAHGHRVTLPVAYLVTLVWRASDDAAVMAKLPGLLAAAGGRLLPREAADHEWRERANTVSVKRLGPGLVPAEVRVPLDRLAAVLDEVGKKITQPVVKEGVIIRQGRGGKPEVVILGFIPADTTSFSYNLVFGLSLSILKIAESHGGSAYATGLYFQGKAEQLLGRERLARLREFRKAHDPKGIINPGKVLGGGLIPAAIAAGQAMEPLTRRFGNAVSLEVGEKFKGKSRDIPPDVAYYAQACSQCGYCVDECDQFYGRGWESQSPRGKWYWLREYMAGREKWDQKMVDTFLVCTTCEMCDTRCSTNLPIEPSWMKLRGILVNDEKRMTFPPFEMMAAALRSEGNIWAGHRKDRTNWVPEDLRPKLKERQEKKTAKVVYFGGCTASYVEHDIAIGAVRLLDKAGVDFTILCDQMSCCGTPMLVAGKWNLFAETMKSNVEAVKKLGADTVVASCPACDMMWRNVYPEWTKKLGIDYPIKARHYSEIVSEKIKDGSMKFPAIKDPVTVTWHDSCHIGRASGVYEPPRDMIKAIPGVTFVEMAHHHEQAHCCGSVLTLIKEPAVAADIGEVKLNEAIEAGASKILALCPCCQVQMRVTADKKKSLVEIEDLSHFACRTLGYELPDPHPEVRKQWGVFDAFIKLMTPQGFADLMGTMWPELIDAMPLGMGKMMRAMGKVPGALELMKPMFPVLFPRLLPLMMPKVMPTMLRRVEAMIPMPDYMREQMPDLMPKVMAELMPHMIGDVVPLVTQPLIDHLKGKKAA